ncbi:glycoside hydrolase family 65 protein [Pseudonocardia xinjiangensis]|uniref:Glycoside hydrolase family 65 protein n=1 Tax=Pseudonocardia xinjiangensis TaxID=75289 RepID=A0ABX1RCN8_9PSEU|nr:glycoside hydrolase family 65 protein [Pseudonocardia xinjiangensis]NMH77215.1 glycoside hydrolase family 65 protein [Pseudonocardia xinjiangensis]
MPEKDAYTVEPWCVREPKLRLDVLADTETVFALSNGCLGLRGTLDEGEPVAQRGSYLAGFHELRTFEYPETAAGDPEATQTLVNTIDGTFVRLLVDGHPFDVRSGELLDHERVLDLRAGTLRRRARWRTPDDRVVEIESERLVSFAHRSGAAIRYSVRAVDAPVEVVLQSGLVANAQLPDLPSVPSPDDLLKHPLVGRDHRASGTRLTLVHRARRSGLLVGAAADHELDAPQDFEVHAESEEDAARFTVTGRLETGAAITLVKYLGYAWSGDRSLSAVRDEVAAAVTAVRHTGWDELLAAQRRTLDEFWESADVEIDGDDELQQAVRFALWHLLQATLRAEGRAIAGKALTGTGYEGHAFWDTETFVLQVMTAVRPEVTRHALGWRHAILDKARARARQLDLQGAAFPWRTIAGEECSGYWPAGTIAFHVNADIADAVIRYVDSTDDEEFARTTGLDLLVETARLWMSLGHHGRDGAFHIYGVTGPDEYSALSDDNVYTNLMAQRNLRGAANWAQKHRDSAEALDVGDDEIASWLDAADAMFVPYDEDLGVHPQAAGFTDQPRWDFAGTPENHYPLHSHYPYFQLYRKQVVKQADLVLAMFLRGDAFTDEEKARNMDYYEQLTVRDSSLSASNQAVLAAEVGYLDLAHDYVAESALADLRDLEHSTADGLHLAALAGTWIAIVAGFGGLRQVDAVLHFRPALPSRLQRLCFRMCFRGRLLRVRVEAGTATYEVLRGEPLVVLHEGNEVELTAGVPVERPLTPREERTPPRQPETRALGRRARPPEAA